MRLSKRELEILELLSWGYCDKEIGCRLQISPRTVQTHVSRVNVKLGARNRTSAVAIYIRHHCIQTALA